MTTGTVYLKADQHTEVTNPKVLLQDVLKVYSADSNLEKKISGLLLFQSKAKKTPFLLCVPPGTPKVPPLPSAQQLVH